MSIERPTSRELDADLEYQSWLAEVEQMCPEDDNPAQVQMEATR